MKKISSLGVACIVSVLLSACATPPPAGEDSSASKSPGDTPAATPAPRPEGGRAPAPAPARPSSDYGKPPTSGAPAAGSPVTKAPEPAPAPAPAAPLSKAEQLLAEGTELYDNGDYRGAIRKLVAARDAADDGSAAKQSSLRLLAFSYCVTSQRPLCRAQFVSLLKMAPDFELTRSEAGHPLWGPVFKEVKAPRTAKPPVKKP
jgi:hypothetical protein